MSRACAALRRFFSVGWSCLLAGADLRLDGAVFPLGDTEGLDRIQGKEPETKDHDDRGVCGQQGAEHRRAFRRIRA